MINSCLFTRLSNRHDFSRRAVYARFVRIFLTAGLTGLLVGCSFINLEDHRLESPSRKVQEAVDKVRTDLEKSLGNSVPSLNVLIQTPSQRIFVSSVPAGQTPVIETANFRIGSNTKNFTATAILNMHEEGWLNYKARITDLMPGTNMPYVPNTPAWDFPHKKDITIEQLLQHSAGVYDMINDTVAGFNGESYVNYVLSRDSTHRFTTEEILKPIIDNSLSSFAPGTNFYYSNTGYMILSRIIERVYSAKSGSARTYADYLYDHITGPNSRVPLPISFPYRVDDLLLPQPNVTSVIRPASFGMGTGFGPVNMSAYVGTGNGYGTMAALNTYVRSLMRGENVLQPQTVKLMQTDVSLAAPYYGLGTAWFDNLGYGHNGSFAGYLSVMAYDPVTDVSVVAMLPLWDLSQVPASFEKLLSHMYSAAYEAKGALGYPIKR